MICFIVLIGTACSADKVLTGVLTRIWSTRMVRADLVIGRRTSGCAGMWEVVVVVRILRLDNIISRLLGIIFALVKILNQQLYDLSLIFVQVNHVSRCFLTLD